jgi:hypothetical protein
MPKLGAKVMVREFDETFREAILAGWYNSRAQFDRNTGRLLTKAGVVYVIRYHPDMGVYNVFEDRIEFVGEEHDKV